MSPAPAMTHTGQRLLDALGPLDVDAEENDYALRVLLGAIATGWDTVGDIARDQDDGRPGFAVLFDPDECPAAFLPWVAQFVGVEMLPNMTEAQQRVRLKETAGTRRGTPAAIEGAARQFLIGPDGTGSSATVYLIERQGGAYQLGVATLASETPDEAAVLRGLLEQKPAGLVLTYTTIVGGDWETLESTHTDWDDVEATFASWDALRADPSVT